MSVKHSILALLWEGPAYGYHIRGEFEERTGGTWPLNIGQVYTTLERLERDGLVSEDGADAEGKRMYSITEAGREEVDAWFTAPIAPANPPRNELAIKIALGVAMRDVDITQVIQNQRSATLRSLQDYTRAKRAENFDPSDPDKARTDLAGLLVLESLIFTAEAEIKWLDHCEAYVIRLRSHPLPPARAKTRAPADVLNTSSAVRGRR